LTQVANNNMLLIRQFPVLHSVRVHSAECLAITSRLTTLIVFIFADLL